jgi:hypothetical protein
MKHGSINFWLIIAWALPTGVMFGVNLSPKAYCLGLTKLLLAKEAFLIKNFLGILECRQHSQL